MRFISPLRYPGGKRKLGPFFARLLADQPSPVRTYAEPYAGGAGAGLFLLSEGHIDSLLINDLNPGIAAFWRSILRQPQSFVDRIKSVDVNLATWHAARRLYLDPAGASDLDLGFATFFLNRCNRSGILSARPIGGLDQTGTWKIDARFNKEDLSSRIEMLAALESKIRVTEMPALAFLRSIGRRSKPVLLYVDPPYLVKGEDLYMSCQTWKDNENLSKALVRQRHPWILTYEIDARVRSLYEACRCLEYGISHTAHSQKVGYEYMLFSPGLRVADVSVVPGHDGVWVS